MIEQYRAVTKDGEVVYGFGVDHYSTGFWYLLGKENSQTKKYLIDPASLATLVNAEEVERARELGYDYAMNTYVYDDREGMAKDYARARELDTARYASYYQLGFEMTKGGDIVKTVADNKDIFYYELIFKDWQVYYDQVPIREGGYALINIPFQTNGEVVGSKYLNPELLENKND